MDKCDTSWTNATKIGSFLPLFEYHELLLAGGAFHRFPDHYDLITGIPLEFPVHVLHVRGELRPAGVDLDEAAG